MIKKNACALVKSVVLRIAHLTVFIHDCAIAGKVMILDQAEDCCCNFPSSFNPRLDLICVILWFRADHSQINYWQPMCYGYQFEAINCGKACATLSKVAPRKSHEYISPFSFVA